MDYSSLETVGTQIRRDILTVTTGAGSGHPTSSLSSVDMMTVLFGKYFRYDVAHPKHAGNDHVIFSKGHATPLLYSLWKAAGVIDEKEFVTYRQFQSRLEGHPTPRFPLTEVTTGSLGQGLAIGVGMAIGLKKRYEIGATSYDKKEEENDIHTSNLISRISIPNVYVLMGDGELAEGSVWEAAALASHEQLHNLIAFVDCNSLGQSGSTMYAGNAEILRRRFEAFGWGAILIDGHDYNQIDVSLQKVLNFHKGPSVIIGKTIKGKGVSFLEGKNGWHGKVLPKDLLEKALLELPLHQATPLPLNIQKPEEEKEIVSQEAKKEKNRSFNVSVLPYGTKNIPVATRQAFGETLAEIVGIHPELFVIDGDVGNSTYTEYVQKKFPEHFLQGFIAEQTMVGVGVGLAAQGLRPVVSTFASFLSRGFDQLRMAALSRVTMMVNGSHVGVSIGPDGPSQMGLEDITMMRVIPGSTVFYPSDAVSTRQLVVLAADTSGITYIRTTRSPLPILYRDNEQFLPGGSKVFPSNGKNKTQDVTIIAAGITLHEALKAQKELEKKGIAVTVIDCYSIKPIDEKTLKTYCGKSKKIIVVEDHYPEGGLGEAVRSALGPIAVPFFHLAVRKIPMSGTTEDLLRYEEIDSAAIILASQGLALRS